MKNDDYENPWQYNGVDFKGSDIGKFYGFTYLITSNITGKKYIGKKFFWSIRKVKGKTRRVRSESDWKNYYGSCKELLEEIKINGKENYRREILGLYATKGQVNYNEVKLQFKYDVLEATDEHGTRIFYNENINGKWFPPSRVMKSPE